jgi:bisphosphoglycerate-independent phosphoglycerate mutase (AlkP superfamily)
VRNLVLTLCLSEHESGAPAAISIADVAPTLLDMLGVPQPAEMTGTSLRVRK